MVTGGLANGITTVLGGGLLAEAGIGGALAIGAVSGAAGSIVGQAVGVATRIQDKFSWKAVGMAAIGGAVSAGIGPDGLFGSDGMFGGVKSGMVQAGLRSAAGNAITQGIGRVTGLQSNFSWAGVAAAGVGASAGFMAADRLDGSALGRTLGEFGSGVAVNTANTLANAATRSAIEGSSFERNVIAAIPDVIGQALGNVLGEAIAAAAASRPVSHVQRFASNGSLPAGTIVPPPDAEGPMREMTGPPTKEKYIEARDSWIPWVGHEDYATAEAWIAYYNKLITRYYPTFNENIPTIGNEVQGSDIIVEGKRPVSERPSGASADTSRGEYYTNGYIDAKRKHEIWRNGEGKITYEEGLRAAADLRSRQAAAQQEFTYQVATAVLGPPIIAGLGAAGVAAVPAAKGFVSARRRGQI